MFLSDILVFKTSTLTCQICCVKKVPEPLQHIVYLKVCQRVWWPNLYIKTHTMDRWYVHSILQVAPIKLWCWIEYRTVTDKIAVSTWSLVLSEFLCRPVPAVSHTLLTNLPSLPRTQRYLKHFQNEEGKLTVSTHISSEARLSTCVNNIWVIIFWMSLKLAC